MKLIKCIDAAKLVHVSLTLKYIANDFTSNHE